MNKKIGISKFCYIWVFLKAIKLKELCINSEPYQLF